MGLHVWPAALRVCKVSDCTGPCTIKICKGPKIMLYMRKECLASAFVYGPIYLGTSSDMYI